MSRGGGSRGRLAVLAAASAALVLLAAACGTGGEPPPASGGSRAAGEVTPTQYALSETARAGETLFNANCSACHGVGATGTGRGPTLIDRIYHPGHHPDSSFFNAVRLGVRQHHWGFGNMAPVPGVPPGDVEKIVCYVREIQRAEGIFEGDAFPTVC